MKYYSHGYKSYNTCTHCAASVKFEHKKYNSTKYSLSVQTEKQTTELLAMCIKLLKMMSTNREQRHGLLYTLH